MRSKVGEIFTTNEGFTVEIVNYKDSDNVDVIFEDGHIITVQYGHLKRGKVRNRNRASIFGVGFIGIGKYKTKEEDNSKHNKFYITWRNMIERCNSENYKQQYPSYNNCSTDEYWHNFQNFAKWYEENYNPEIMEGWHLDKDILVKGNKVYSPETCCFVPNEINSFFVKGKSRRGNCLIGVSLHRDGKFMASCNLNKKVKNLGYFKTELEAFQAYKYFKENLATELADKWRGQITEQVYQALINYKVEIDD
jgi:hypothetical protein